MTRMRITAAGNGLDQTGELRRLSDLRRDLYSHSPVEVDPDSPAHATRRDVDRLAYFEFVTQFPEEVERVVRERGHGTFVTVSRLADTTAAEPCLRCGHVAERETPAVCPNCGLREISACPNCQTDVSREAYEEVAGDLFRCPVCRHHVRLSFNDPIRRPDGGWNQPVVVVESAMAEQV